MEFEFAFQMQYTSFKSNVPQTSTIHLMDNNIMCLSIVLHFVPPPLLMIASDDRRSEMVITPEEEDHRKNRVSSARQANPIGHIYKIQIPSQSRLCMFRRSPRHVLSHS